jgi:hypothetical protein
MNTDPNRVFFDRWRLVNTHEYGVVIIQNQRLCGWGRSIQEARTDASVKAEKTLYSANSTCLIVDLQLSKADFLSGRMRMRRGVTVEQLGGIPDNSPKPERITYVIFNPSIKDPTEALLVMELGEFVEKVPERYRCYSVDIAPWVMLEHGHTMHRKFKRAFEVLQARVAELEALGWQVERIFGNEAARDSIAKLNKVLRMEDLGLAALFYKDRSEELEGKKPNTSGQTIEELTEKLLDQVQAYKRFTKTDTTNEPRYKWHGTASD